MQEADRLQLLGAVAELASSAADVEELLAGAVRITSAGLAVFTQITLLDGSVWSCPPSGIPNSTAGLGHTDEQLMTEQTGGCDSCLETPLLAGGQRLGVLKIAGMPGSQSASLASPSPVVQIATFIALALEGITLRRRVSDESWVRSQVLSTVSHDFRTPLTTIRGVAQLLLRRRAQAPEGEIKQIENRLTLIDRAAVQLGGMIDEVLDFARLETDVQLDLNCSPVDLCELVGRVAEAQQVLTDEHEVRLELPSGPVIGSWDGRRIERVLSKIVANAVRYSPVDGRTRISVTHAADAGSSGACVSIAVIDEGAGIPTADLPNVFGDERRIAKAVRGRRGGRLDLRGCRQIIEQHGGVMSVKSEDGKGTIVNVVLPLVSPKL